MSRRADGRRVGCSGLALVELLVALVVLGVVLTAGWRAASAASERQALVRDRIYAQWVAQDALARLRAQRLWPAVGNREYEATQAGRAFVVREQVTTTPNRSFRQVRLRVHEAGDSGQHLTELVGFVREPADRPAADLRESGGRDGVRVGLADAR
jgi:general secretion pathway protein I